MSLTLSPSSTGTLFLTQPYPLSVLTIYNVKDYGAAGDDVSNDTAAIQAAITAAAGSGVVYFPAGTYKITSALTLPGNTSPSQTGVTLFGANRNSTIIKQYTASTPILSATNTADYYQGVTIENLKLQYATQSATTDTGAYAIAWNSPLSAYGWTVRRCWIDRAYIAMGINAVSGSVPTWGLLVDDCWITDTRHSIVKLASPVAVGMPSNEFRHLYCANTPSTIIPDGAAFDFVAASVVMSDIDLEGWYNTALSYSGNGQALAVTGFYLEHHVFNTGSTSLLFDLASDAIFDSVAISASVTSNTSAYMFSTSASSRLYVRGASSVLTIGGGSGAEALLSDGTCRVYFNGDWRSTSGALVVPGSSGNLTKDLVGGTRSLAYSASIATDASVPSDTFQIVATNGTAFTLTSPTNGVVGRRITYDIKNSSGGALGTVTWGAAFLLAGSFTNPGNGKRRTISFYYDGTNWVETNRAAADI